MPDLIERLRTLSNWSKKGMAPRDTIYASFHLPGFEYTNAHRNTLKRLNYVGVPSDLSGVRVLQLASNMGAISLELARRVADVTAVEYSPERCEWANEVAERFSLKAKFHVGDLELEWPAGIEHNTYDFVICAALDLYIKDKPRLWVKLNQVTSGTLWFESNDRSKNRIDEMRLCSAFSPYFKDVHFLYLDDDRPVFVFGKKGAPWPLSFYPLKNATEKRDGFYVKTVECPKRFEYLKWCYQRIKNIPAVVPMDFSVAQEIRMPDLNPCEEVNDISCPEKLATVKEQLIRFIWQLSKAGFRHGDLHSRNVVLKDGKLVVLDWDTVAVDVSYGIKRAWDVSGEVGRGSCYGYGPVLKTQNKMQQVSLRKVLDLKPEDFAQHPRIPLL